MDSKASFFAYNEGQSTVLIGGLIMFAEIFILTCIHFLLRLPLIRKVPRGVDAQFHLLAASKFSRGLPPKSLGRFVVGDKYTHPPFLHFILSLFPKIIRPQLLLILGVVSDYAIVLLTYFTALIYLPEIYALVAALFYTFTPAAFAQSISESPRPLGTLWYVLSILLLLRGGVFESVLASIVIALALLTHKMATQTLFFTCLLISPFLYLANNLFVLAILFGFILAVLITKGNYLNVLKDHIGYIRFHMRYGSWDKGRKTIGSPSWLLKMQPFFYIPMLGLIIAPISVLAVQNIFAWYVSILLIFFLWLWGDSYRYLAYSAMPTAILTASVLYKIQNPLFLIFLIPSLIICILIIGKIILNFIRNSNLPDLKKISIPENSIVMVVPSSITYYTARFLQGKVLCGGGNSEALRFELEILPRELRQDPDKLLEEFNINYILVGPKHLDFIKNFKSTLEMLNKTDGYVLYRRKIIM